MSDNFTIDQKRWANLSIFEQMGNIYSEVGRSFNAKRCHNDADCQAAVHRAIELFDATVDALIARKSPKTKEVLRAKEQYLAVIHDPGSTEEAIAGLDRYFLQFAIAARLSR